MNTNTDIKTMDRAFFEEYTSHAAILKYTRSTAGHGIGYLLDHDYKDIYLRAIESLPAEARQRGIRILEFGCGAGMNIVHLLSILAQAGIKVEKAVGTDFSPVLIEAARRESKHYLPREALEKIEFHVARNESLSADLAAATATGREQWLGSFDLLLGVNTMRYCHRGGREMSAARDIMDLLKPGGVCVNIDMSDRFPLFRSALRNKLRGSRQLEECYIPSLTEYAAPFAQTGFEILRREQFCWIPHSAGWMLCLVLRCLAPLLNVLCPSRAMRSLVLARKPLPFAPA